MYKSRQARFVSSVSFTDNDVNIDMHGTEDDIAFCVEQGALELIRRSPSARPKLRRAIWRVMWKTKPDWIDYLLTDWQKSIVGMCILAVLLYGFCAFCHVFGVV